ncbi:Rv1476 family membrane protein [Nocardia tengchongensis]
MTVSHPSVFTPVKAELPPNTDLNKIIADLADDHVAAPEGRDQEALAAIAADARDHGVALDIVVVPGNPGIEANLRDLANEVGKLEHGTVVVFSDDWVGTFSDQFTRGRLERAEDGAKYRGPEHTADAAQVFVDRLQQPEAVSWTVITLVLLGVLIAGIGGLYLVKVRRARDESRPSAPVA